MNRTKPKLWLYALALAIALFGCLAAMTLVYAIFPDLPGSLQASLNLDNLTQVVVPGAAEITFDKSGAYAVYHEYRSVVDGRTYIGSPSPPDLACRLVAVTTGHEIAVVPDHVQTNAYATQGQARVGRLMGSITLDEPGTYTFSCHYASGRSQPAVVLAVGPNFFWEFLGIAARVVAAIGAGLLVLVASGGIAILLAIIVAVRRHRAAPVGAG